MAVLDAIKNLTNSINNKGNTTSSNATSSNATQKKRNGDFGANFYPS